MQKTDHGAVAYHEAGHAVAARAMACSLQAISIIRSGDTCGRCCYCVPATMAAPAFVKQPDGTRRASTEAEAQAFLDERLAVLGRIVAFGGHVATCILAGCAQHPVFDADPAENMVADGARDDLQEIVGSLSGGGLVKWEIVLPAMVAARRRATRLLLRPSRWRAVEALATVLLERRELPGDEAEHIIEGALADGRQP